MRSNKAIGKTLLLVLILFSAHMCRAHVNDSLEVVLKRTDDPDTRLSLISKMLENTIFNDIEKARGYVIRFREEAIAAEMQAEVARSYNFDGMLAWMDGKDDEAVRYYLKALEEYQETNDAFMIGMMNNNIASVHDKRDKQRALEYYQKALEIFVDLDTLIWVASVKHNMAVVYLFEEQQEPALEHYHQALEIFNEIGDTQYNSSCYSGIGAAYLQLGRHDEALDYLHRALESIVSEHEGEMRAVVYSNLCSAYVKIGDEVSSKKYCDLTEEHLTVYTSTRHIRNNSQVLYEYYRSIGDEARALHFLERVKSIEDSTRSAKREHDISDLTLKYEASEKQRMIDIQNLQLAQNEKEKRMYQILAAVIALLLAIGVWFTVSKLKTNRVLKDKNQIIEKSLKEKELLLREIHHRVKNNLQVISSLLSLQSKNIEDQKALEAVNETKNRVKSMSLIHKNLYQEGNLTGIKAKDYVEKLSKSIFSSYRIEEDKVALATEIDDLYLDVDTTIPVGLILNELITNSLKHAFPDDREGEIRVGLKIIDTNLELEVSDNGIGFDVEDLQQEGGSFGMKMIQAFTRKLNADWNVTSENGTRVRMSIRNYNLAT